jgi:DNA polymerase-3 subunit delta
MATRTSGSSESLSKGREFFRTLAREGPGAPVYVLGGEETFLVDEALERIETRMFPGGRDDFNFAAFQGAEVKGADVVAAADLLPMFAPRRLVLLRNADKMPAAEWKPVAEYAQRPNPATVLVIELTKPDERVKAVKELLAAPSVEVILFPHLSDAELLPWIVRRAQQRGLVLGQDVPEYLLDSVGSSLQQLALAIEKIDLFVGPGEAPRQVTEPVARTVVADGRSRNIFELVEHIASRRVDTALDCFERLLLDGESPVAVTGMIASQFRQLLMIRNGLNEGISGRELAAWANVPPFRVDALSRLVRQFQEDDLIAILERIMRTDHALKSSRLRDSTLVEALILRICGGARE